MSCFPILKVGFDIGPFSFGLEHLFTFISGIIIGIIVFIGIYMSASLRKVHFGMKRSVNEIAQVERDQILAIIEKSKGNYKVRKKDKDSKFMGLIMEICKEEVGDIAKEFNPSSSNPLLELTIDETFMLAHYVINRVDKILSGKIFHLFRGMTIRKFYAINKTKNDVVNSEVGKIVQRYKIVDITKSAMNVINVFNPFHWIKKATYAIVSKLVFDKIALIIIATTGEEAYRIYSKKMFGSEDEIDSGISQIYDNLYKEIDDIYKKDKEKSKEK